MHEGPNQEPNHGPLNYPSGSSLDTDPRKESDYKQVVSLSYCTNIFKNSSNTLGLQAGRSHENINDVESQAIVSLLFWREQAFPPDRGPLHISLDLQRMD